MKRICCLILVALLLLSLTACGSESFAASPSEETRPAVPQYYNTYLAAEPSSMDISQVSDSYSSTIISQVMDSLVRLEELDGSYVINSGDAQTWQTNADGTVWTFYLGDNTWSDGPEVTAQDYVYSLQRSADPATGCPNEYFLEPLAGYAAVRSGAPLDTLGVRALDDKTLEITLAYPVPSFLEMCSGTIYYPQRQDIVEAYGNQYGAEAHTFVCNGPYTMESWNHDSFILLKKRADYWNASNVQIETVNIAIVQDTNTACAMYDAGDLDYVATTSPEWSERFLARSDSNYVQIPTATVNFNFYNTRDPLFQNVNIRKAFTLALDRQELNEKCFGGSNIAATGWVTPSMAVGSASYRDYAGDLIQEMYARVSNSSMTAMDYLLKGMEELGLGADPAALDITFSLPGTDERYQTYGDYLKQTFQTVLHVDLKLQFSSWGDFYNNVLQGNYQVGYMSWAAYYNDPYDVLSLFLTDIDAIRTGWSHAVFDQLVKGAYISMNEDARMAMYKEAEAILIQEECVVNPLMFATSNSFYRDYVTGYATLAFTNTGYKGMGTSSR